MHIHILGVCGTFMAGIAVLARHLGHQVSGSDQQFYPPMSDVLRHAGIDVFTGYEPAHMQPAPDLVIIGNALSRGNRAVEHVLNRNTPYTSGPAWLAEHFLHERWVIAVSGTHGKTTTASMVAWILDDTGLDPGFLIGGLPTNFGASARAGSAPFFVIEADEYDTAFFDKRSKFIHYRPRTVVINNLEFDHADIFANLSAIQTQFHHLVRTVPGNGLIIRPPDDAAISDVLAQGLWTETLDVGSPGKGLYAELETPAGSAFSVIDERGDRYRVEWRTFGEHNVHNALCALAAARHAGVPLLEGSRALAKFQGVSRRLELKGRARGIWVYDDFAHHPSAIEAVLLATRNAHPGHRVIAVLEPSSNTMRMGGHDRTLANALTVADEIWAFQPTEIQWMLSDTLAPLGGKAHIRPSVAQLIEGLVSACQPGDHVVIMSNRSFEGIHQRLLRALEESNGH